jgi:hypothetical protein
MMPVQFPLLDIIFTISTSLEIKIILPQTLILSPLSSGQKPEKGQKAIARGIIKNKVLGETQLSNY